jgi:hypothetical protein
MHACRVAGDQKRLSTPSLSLSHRPHRARLLRAYPADLYMYCEYGTSGCVYLCVGVGERVAVRAADTTWAWAWSARAGCLTILLSPWIDRSLFVGVSFLVRLSGRVVCCHPAFGKYESVPPEGYAQAEHLWAVVRSKRKGGSSCPICLLETAKCNTVSPFPSLIFHRFTFFVFSSWRV